MEKQEERERSLPSTQVQIYTEWIVDFTDYPLWIEKQFDTMMKASMSGSNNEVKS
jgi:hypothetical protein